MGPAKKRRSCPAVGREISAAECGENRHSHFACPDDRPHNPFRVAAYGELLELERRLDPVLRPRMIELVKRQVRQVDEENRRDGRCDDVNELIRALGLAEIDVPPPPPLFEKASANRRR